MNKIIKKVYPAVDYGPEDWDMRYDRNIGWITRDEQEILCEAIIGIAGTGGMGGGVGATAARNGMNIKLGDNGCYDVTNMHRQYGARRATVGNNKALETAKEIRRITDDTQIVVYPQGIIPLTVDDFLNGPEGKCTVVCNEIEFLQIADRINLGKRAQELGIPYFDCNCPGLAVNLHWFPPDGPGMEDILKISYERASILQDECNRGSRAAREEITKLMFAGLVPERVEYKDGDWESLQQRIIEKGTVSIIGSDPFFAASVLMNRILLYLLENSGVKRDYVKLRPAPAYIHIDTAKLLVKVVNERSAA
ncbi:MAG: ThiF family adenylyltransferase [Candidatus Sungbacteria bacterium]|nr:ThiF family adenylyltransferase [Candidatus Sungbacteria bacterium]